MKILLIEGDDEIIARLSERLNANEHLRVVGLFHVMRTRCRCTENDFDTGKHRGQLSSMGPKFKWWVHRVCGKPTPGLQTPKTLLSRDEIKPRTVQAGPEIVIDSLFMHDYGTERGEHA